MSHPKRRNSSVMSVLALLAGGLLTAPAAFAAPGGLYKINPGVFTLGNTNREISQTALDNPDVAGASIRYGWSLLEPTEGNFDFSFLDSEVSRISAANKKVLLRIATQVGKPDWVNTAVQNAQGKFFTFDDGGVTTSIPVFWDPTYLAKKKAMIAALGQHFASNPNVVIVTASFANATSEDWNVPHTPEYVAQWLSLGYTSDKLIDAGKQILDATMAAFPNQRVALALGGNGHVGATGNLDPTADYVAEAIVAYANTAWPRRLVTQVNSVGTFNPVAPGEEGTVWNLMWNNQPTIAGQMVYQCINDESYKANRGVPIDPALALTQSVDAAASYGLRYLEIYQIDVVGLPDVVKYAAGKLGKKK